MMPSMYKCKCFHLALIVFGYFFSLKIGNNWNGISKEVTFYQLKKNEASQNEVFLIRWYCIQKVPKTFSKRIFQRLKLKHLK